MDQTKVVSFPWITPDSRLRSVVKLSQRRLLSFYRDKSDLQVTLLQPPLLALAFFVVFQKLVTTGEVVYFQPLRSYLNPGPGPSILIFLAVLTAIWFGTSKAIVELPSSRILYQQERLTFLKDFDYLLATFISLSLIVGLQVILFSLSFHLLFVSVPAWLHPYETYLVETKEISVTLWTVLMPKLWVIFTALLWLTAVSAIALAMLVSVFVKTRMAAVTVMTFVMIIQLLLGGSIVKPVRDMHLVVQTIATFIPSRWGLEGAIILFERFLNFKGGENFSFAGTAVLRTENESIFITHTLQNVKSAELITDHWLANYWSQALIEAGRARKREAESDILSKEEEEYLEKLLLPQEAQSSTAKIPQELLNQPVPELLMDKACQYFKTSLEEAVKPILQKVNQNQNESLSPEEQKLWQSMLIADPTLKWYRPEHTLVPWFMLATLSLGFFLFAWLGFILESKL